MFQPQKKEYYVFTHDEFDDFVKEKLKIDYEFVAVQEANNYSLYQFSIRDGDTVWDDDIEKILNRQSTDPQSILTFLCTNYYLPYGEYLIEVYW